MLVKGVSPEPRASLGDDATGQRNARVVASFSRPCRESLVPTRGRGVTPRGAVYLMWICCGCSGGGVLRGKVADSSLPREGAESPVRRLLDLDPLRLQREGVLAREGDGEDAVLILGAHFVLVERGVASRMIPSCHFLLPRLSRQARGYRCRPTLQVRIPQ